MRNLLFLLMVVFFAVLSCRNDEDGVQRIDQILNLYIDSAGQDMLNSKIAGSYISVQLNDVYGLRDIAPLTFTDKKNADTLHYLEYVAGARRLTIDSAGVFKTYESKIALALTRKITDSTTAVSNDTMIIHYSSAPELFQVTKVWYNNLLEFTKVAGEPNNVKIRK